MRPHDEDGTVQLRQPVPLRHVKAVRDHAPDGVLGRADIARAAGVSKGTFDFHFASKEAILLDMSSATAQAMIDQVEAGVR